MNLVLGTMTFGESVFPPDVDCFIHAFLCAGYVELDTAFVYNNGNCERMLGDVLTKFDQPYKVATKVNPRVSGRLDGETAYMQVEESLRRMKLGCVDTVYLHFPDPATPVLSVLDAMADLHDQGKYRELGLSNFPAWMVADVWHICDRYGWVKPTVYEGIYNPLTRKAEIELNDCLNAYGMRFYAYNPLAGGLLSGRYNRFEDIPSDGRFTHRPNYQKRYWIKSFFDAVELMKTASEKYGITITEAVYRWLAYHSMLDEKRGDSIIIGASKLVHLKQNMSAIEAGSLPEELVTVFEKAWQMCRADSPEYFTIYKSVSPVRGEKA